MKDNDLRYTVHAEGSVTTRDIPQPTVMAAIVSGEMVEERSGVRRYTLEGFVVVVDGNNVVTTYFDSDLRQSGQWSPKKKQRKGQRKRTAPESTWIGKRGRKINIELSERYARQMEGR